MLIEMSVANLAIDPATNLPFVLLEDREKKNSVPIWIGFFEATAIATEIQNIHPKRPMTHDLLRSVVKELEAELVRIEVNDLKDNTYHATLIVKKKGGEETQIDSRPSDAIALAIRTRSPIFVSEDVINKSQAHRPKATMELPTEDKQKWEEILRNLSPEAFGKYKQ